MVNLIDKWQHPDFDPAEVAGPWSVVESDQGKLVNKGINWSIASNNASGFNSPGSFGLKANQIKATPKKNTQGNVIRKWNGFILHHPGGTADFAINYYKKAIKNSFNGFDWISPNADLDGAKFRAIQGMKAGEARFWQWMGAEHKYRGHFLIGLYGDLYVWHEPSSGEVAAHTGFGPSRVAKLPRPKPGTKDGKGFWAKVDHYQKFLSVVAKGEADKFTYKSLYGEDWKKHIASAGLQNDYRHWLARWDKAKIGDLEWDNPHKPNPIELAKKVMGSAESINRICIGVDFAATYYVFKKVIESKIFKDQAKDDFVKSILKDSIPQLCQPKFGYSHFQYRTFNLISQLLLDSRVLEPNYGILGHEDVAPIERIGGDPGPAFCWDLINLPERNARVGRRSVRPGIASVNPDFIGGITPDGFVESGNSHLIDGLGPADFLTPEEVRKGIISQYFQIQDWHMVTMSEAIGENTTSPEASSDNSAPNTQTGVLNTNRNISQVALKNSSTTFSVFPDMNGESSSGDWIFRDRLAISIVEAEFYRRRFRARSVPSVTGPFNPYPVAGFPGLILSPLRPVLGMVSNVTHNINVSSATATTTVSLSSPRYWDEGEVWYWLGGESLEANRPDGSFKSIHSMLGDNTHQTSGVTRFFPIWQNRYVVPTNSYDKEKRERLTNLDKFYGYLLGCKAIEYESNHKVVPFLDSDIQLYIESKTTDSPFEVNEETLDIREYNRLIASVSKSGHFAEGTIAEKFWGKMSPRATEIEVTSDIKNAAHQYTKRYGIREYELFTVFLKNRYAKIKFKGQDFTIIAGDTFMNVPGNKKIYLNSIQKMLLSYNIEMKRRSTNIDGTD